MRGGDDQFNKTEMGSHGPPQAPIFCHFFLFCAIFYFMSRRGSRMRLEGSAGGSVAWRLPDCGSKYPGARARHRVRRGVGYQFVSSVSQSLCSTFFSRVGP